MVLVDALFINKGGGAVLLQYLIAQIMNHPQKDDFFFVLDPRFRKPEVLQQNYIVIDNTLKARSQFYKQNKHSYTKVFCFANTPPPVKLKVPVYTYSHNYKLFDARRNRFKPVYFRLYLKYFFIWLYNDNTDYYVVQTQHMVDEIVKFKLKDAAHCLKLPFYDSSKYAAGQLQFDARPQNEFVYVGTPTPQKNHVTLLAAWEYLFEQGHKPVLHITIDDTAPALLAEIDRLRQKGVNVINHGFTDPRLLYFNHPFLIFPSLMESFGLPLIEAAESGMKVLASELPYVYNVIKPSLTFNPADKTAIAAAVIIAQTRQLPFPEVTAKNEIDGLIKLLMS